MAGVGGVPATHALRLQHKTDGHNAPAHRAVRAAHQPVQREDLHLPVVLDGVRVRGHDIIARQVDLGTDVPVFQGSVHP